MAAGRNESRESELSKQEGTSLYSSSLTSSQPAFHFFSLLCSNLQIRPIARFVFLPTCPFFRLPKSKKIQAAFKARSHSGFWAACIHLVKHGLSPVWRSCLRVSFQFSCERTLSFHFKVFFFLDSRCLAAIGLVCSLG